MGSIGTCFGIEGKGNKIMYFSPSFGGLTFGVSFTPTGGQRRAGGGLSYGTDVTAPGPGNAGNNILSVGVDYVHDFGGWNLTAGGGGEWAFTQYTPAGGNTNNKPQWYQAGIQVGFGHFAIGASGAYYVNYAHAGYAATTATSGDDGWVASGGASYTLDAWSFGIQGLYGEYEQSASRSGIATFTNAGKEKLWGVSFNTRLCPRAGHLARRSGCLYQCELRQSYRLRRLRTRGGRGRRHRRQCPFLGNRSGYRDQLLIVGKTTTTSGERFAAPPFSFEERGVSADLGGIVAEQPQPGFAAIPLSAPRLTLQGNRETIASASGRPFAPRCERTGNRSSVRTKGIRSR